MNSGYKLGIKVAIIFLVVIFFTHIIPQILNSDNFIIGLIALLTSIILIFGVVYSLIFKKENKSKKTNEEKKEEKNA